MKESYEFDTLVQKEALINEFKGNLFEFLVARDIAEIFGIKQKFFARFIQDREKQRYFQNYESWLREHSPNVLQNLPLLSKEVAKALETYLLQLFKGSVSGIDLVGKSFGQEKKVFHEADLILRAENQRSLPLSLKLCKKGSYVNTKSAGVGSFIKKYFSPFSLSDFHQTELNKILDNSFQRMGEQLYEELGLSFKGNFDLEWRELGLSELPGQLPDNLKNIVHSSYDPIIEKIFWTLKEFHRQDPKLFSSCLQQLLGVTDSRLLQVFCFHKGTEKYTFDHVEIYSASSVQQELESLCFDSAHLSSASFELKLRESLFQIRVKPMNKFTAKSHKINCSLRHLPVQKNQML